jgi:hypothetical protein
MLVAALWNYVLQISSEAPPQTDELAFKGLSA